MRIKNTQLVLWKNRQLWQNPEHITKKEVIESTSHKIRGGWLWKNYYQGSMDSITLKGNRKNIHSKFENLEELYKLT